MPFISQRQIASDLRSKAEKDYRKQLRAALLTPGLPAEQRRDIQARLAAVGQPRVYDRNSPPLPGAIELPPPEPEPQPVLAPQPVPAPRLALSPDVLRGMKKADLQTLAEQHDLPTTGTVADLIRRLTAA